MATEQAAPTKIFKRVPLDPMWTLAGTKLDLKAIYRRPRRSIGEYDEVIQERGPDGLPLYDLTGPLPLRRHGDWTAKGFEYVTVLSSVQPGDESFKYVASSLRAAGLNPAEYLQHPTFGTWNPKLYLATADNEDRSKFDALRAMVEQVGSDAVIAVRRMNDPNFTLPASLQGVPAGGTVLRNQAGQVVTGSAEVPGPRPSRVVLCTHCHEPAGLQVPAVERGDATFCSNACAEADAERQAVKAAAPPKPKAAAKAKATKPAPASEVKA
jgi:hypothetical protein